MMGHKVTLYEKTDHLGGMFVAAAAPSFKEKDKELLQWYSTQISKLPITVKLNETATDLEKLDADEIVIATGARPRKLNLPGFENGIDATDYLLGNRSVGDTVAIIGGGLTGCEIAYDLALKGKKPFIVEMTDELVKTIGIFAANSSCLRDLIRYHQIPVYLESSLKEIQDGTVILNTKDGEQVIRCDDVILSVGYVAGTPLAKESSEHIHILGDAAKVGNLQRAIWSAYDLAFSF